jgi:lipopolysaccharide assembly outer membrane protein LptD (OstA)
VTETFKVEEHLNNNNVQTIERSFPLSSVLMTSYRPGKHFSYLIGVGGEFSHTGNLFLWRVGVEYGYEINEKWEINGNLTNDLKINSYNSWAIGLGITRVINNGNH